MMIRSFQLISSIYKHQYLDQESEMKIAVASQNRREITDHTGRCRKFWIYKIENGTIANKELLELTKQQSFHDSSPNDPSPLDDMQVLITGGMGASLVRRLENRGVKALITSATDPDKAVNDYLNRTLATLPAEPHEHNHKHAS
jgi:predicted Fe-Mo cluster-binding NifX family protein